jgi:shikimate kinase
MTELPPRVYLVGPRGSGKTTVGRLLAGRLGWSFLDMDERIEAAAGRSVAQLFFDEGEAGFRDREAAVLRELAARPGLVIATGGGVVLRPDNRDTLRATGHCVWLAAHPATLFARIQGDPATAGRRPPLTGLSGLEEIEHVLAVREPLYRAVAHQTVVTEHLSPDAVVSAILSACSTSS